MEQTEPQALQTESHKKAQQKQEQKPTIRWRHIDKSGGVYAYIKGKGAITAINKRVAIDDIKKEWPGEYDVVEITQDRDDRNNRNISPKFTNLSSPKAVEDFRKSASEFTKEATQSKELAMKALVDSGIYTESGELSKEYQNPEVGADNPEKPNQE